MDEVEVVQQAVHQLYHSVDPEEKAQAEQWLRTTATIDASWETAWTLLQPNRSFETRFFGTIILEHKITRMWSTLDENSKRSLAQQLIQLTAEIYSSQKALFLRCSYTLSILILKSQKQAVPENLENFEIAIYEQFQQTLDSTSGLSAVLHLFKTLGEEYTGRFMSTARRRLVDVEMHRAKPKIMELCWSVINENSDENAQLVAMECASSWTFSFPNWDNSLPFAQKAFEFLSVSNLCSAAVDLILEVLQLDEAFRMPSVMRDVGYLVVNTQDIFANAMQPECVFRALTHLAAIIGQKYISIFAEDVNLLQAYTQHILAITSMPGQVPRDETISHETHFFWNNFADYIVDLEPERFRTLRDQFGAYFLQVLEAAVVKGSYPPSTEPQLSKDELQVFRQYRSDMGEVTTCVFMLLKNDCLMHLHHLLQAAVSEQSLERAESVLYFFSSAAEMLEGSIQGPNSFINTIATFMPGYTELDKTCLNALSSCADWLNQNASRIPDVIEIVRARLGIMDLILLASNTLKNIARASDEHLGDYLSQVLELTLPFLNEDVPALAKRHFAETICYSVRCVVAETVTVTIPRVYEPSLVLIDRCLESGTTEARTVLIEQICLIKCIIKALDPENLGELPHPTLSMMQSSLHRLMKCVVIYTDQEVASEVCACFSSAIRSLDHRFDVLLPDVVPFLLKGYESTQFSYYVDTLTNVMLLFHDQREQQNNFQEAFHQCFSLAARCIDNYEASDPESISSFFHLVFKVTRACSAIVLYDQTTVSRLLEYLMLGISLNEGPHNNILSEILPENLPHMVTTVIRTIAGGVTKSIFPYYVDILAEINKMYVDIFGQAMIQALAAEDIPISEQDAHFTVQQLSRAVHMPAYAVCRVSIVVNRQRFLRVMDSFRRQCLAGSGGAIEIN
eukprot:gene2073-5132_t